LKVEKCDDAWKMWCLYVIFCINFQRWWGFWLIEQLLRMWMMCNGKLPLKELFQQWRLSRLNCATRSTMCGWMTWWYVTSSGRYSSRLMMLILFEHSLERDRGKGIYLLILFSTLLASYISSFLFKIVLLLKKWRTSFISIYDYLYILCHIWICDKIFAQTL